MPFSPLIRSASLVLLLPALLLLPGCGGSESADATELVTARALWSDAEPASYQLTIREVCFCPEVEWIDTIVDGEVTEHRPGTDDAGFWDPGARSMPDLFRAAERAIDDGPFFFAASYDPATGALLELAVDPEENTVDEEWGFTVTVEILEP